MIAKNPEEGGRVLEKIPLESGEMMVKYIIILVS
jgi:hypothetical protein